MEIVRRANGGTGEHPGGRVNSQAAGRWQPAPREGDGADGWTAGWTGGNTGECGTGGWAAGRAEGREGDEQTSGRIVETSATVSLKTTV